MSLSVRVRVRKARFVLDVSLEVPSEGVTGVQGPSGSGKTTLLRAVAGLEPQSRGSVRLDDTCWQDDKKGVFVPAHRRGVGMVFQDAALFPHLTVRGNLEYGARRAPRATAGLGFDQVVALLGIGPLLSRMPQGLSGGERQRVAMARALVANPRLLLMDEPLASLDWEARASILPYLERLPDELDIPVMYVSHNIEELDRLAARVVRIRAGRVVGQGPLRGGGGGPGEEVGGGEQNVVPAVVREHDPVSGVTSLSFGQGKLQLAFDRRLEIGELVRVRLPPDRLVIVRASEVESTAPGWFQATVDHVDDLGSHCVLVGLKVADTHLHARVPVGALNAMGLSPGERVEVLASEVVKG